MGVPEDNKTLNEAHIVLSGHILLTGVTYIQNVVIFMGSWEEGDVGGWGVGEGGILDPRIPAFCMSDVYRYDPDGQTSN